MGRAVIFDCDGVLFDSWHANVGYYNAIFAALGLPALDAEGERKAHVLSSPQLFVDLFGEDEALIARAQAAARDLDYGPFYRHMQPAPGLYALLGELKRRYRLAMATNRGATVPGVVRHFGLAEFLELAVGLYDVARPKPFPDMIEKCVAHFGVAPREAVYVGDTASDYEAARGAGVHFIGVGDHSGAPQCVQHLTELPVALAHMWPAARPS